jgi:hypothetical protein
MHRKPIRKQLKQGVLAMTIERGLRLAAGAVVLFSVGMGYFAHPAWLLLTAFAGLNLLQSAFTNWRPMVWILARTGFPSCAAGSIQQTP